jgi:hypothetical protein
LGANANVVYVPRPMVKALGLKVGKQAYIRLGEGAVDIYPTSNGMRSWVQARVDACGNIRVGSGTLKAAGIRTRSVTVAFAPNAGSVKITKTSK